MRNMRHKKKERQSRDSLSFSDPSDQKFGLQPLQSKTYSLAGERHIQIFTPALENMTGPLFI